MIQNLATGRLPHPEVPPTGIPRFPIIAPVNTTSPQPPKPASQAAFQPVPARPVPSAIQTVIDALPVTEHRDRIIDAIRNHRVVIVSGETGSGKTTQLPKFCLEAGRAARNGRTRRGGLIGHTQPRRIAASSVATRIAEEMGTPLGTDVGYKIRFNEKVSPGTRIKLMTDGILLAESQRDRLLPAYDTLIIDEAHERSLNIDFLLGYLKQLIDGPRRDDLKLIITSATIDAARFAEHFGEPGKPAPVIEVSGRLYPVEVRYRAPEETAGEDEDDETDLPSAIEAAVHELWNEKPGDVLVFLPGEREIRETAEHLQRAVARGGSSGGRAAKGQGGRSRADLLLASAEIVPLYARLPAADQQRVFNPGNAPRIVLATNVAETSLTVPRIRYVIDSGLARMLRYRIRGKVDQLLIEPVSRAAANQRAGRCGRVAEGVCIRLFSESDFQNRPAFTDPEILRSSLASVILRMNALGLSEVSAFPFLDKPSPKAIADGYALLNELGAMDDRQRLTPIGKQLARLPVDPRLARMLLAGHRTGCLNETLIITAALSVQDPRERPPTAQQAADQAHARFNVPQSDFLSWLKLWRYWQEQQATRRQRGESHRALANRMGREFLSIRKLREWADVISQLTELVRGLNWHINEDEAAPDVIHRALLTGLLGNVAHRLPEGPGWQGTHQQKFVLHPSSILNRRGAVAKAESGKPGTQTPSQNQKGARWLMAAEMVDTGRLMARTNAAIKPEWIESAAQDLIQRSWSNPHWEKNSGRAMAHERGVLYGLVLYTARRVPYEKIDPAESRRLMIRDGLVAGEWPFDTDFIRHNRKVIAEVERLEHKIRRPDLLVDEASLAAWFDAQIPEHITNARDLQQWYREATQGKGPGRDKGTIDAGSVEKAIDASQDSAGSSGREVIAGTAGLLKLSREALLKKDTDGIDEARFPRLLRMRGVDFTLGYHFEPGAADDGVTLTVPLHALNQVDPDRCEWLVPGMLVQKVSLLFKSLPQRWRRHLLPLDGTAAEFVDGLTGANGRGGADTETGAGSKPLIDALLDFLRAKGGWRLAATDFRPENIPAHLQMNFRLVNEHGRILAVSRHLAELQAAYGSRAQSAFQNEFARIAAQMRTRKAGEGQDNVPAAGRASGTSGASGASGAPGAARRGRASASAGITGSSGPGASPDHHDRAQSGRDAQAGGRHDSREASPAKHAVPAARGASAPPSSPTDTVMRAGQRHTRWDFGTLPELLELQTAAGERLVGFPALVDRGDAVEISVYDDPAVAARHHRQGVVRLFALAMGEAVKSLARDVKKNASLELGFNALPGHSARSAPLAEQLASAAIIRSFLQQGLPQNEAQFQQALGEGKPRMLLTAQELARLLQTIVTEHGQIRRKLTGSRADRTALDDIETQLAALFPPGFLHQVGYDHLQHYPRYLKAVNMRLDKLREDPARDRAQMASMAPLLQRWRQWQRDIGMQPDREAESFRWLIEELRVSLFAQSLRTPMPVSVKRLTKVLDQRDGR